MPNPLDDFSDDELAQLLEDRKQRKTSGKRYRVREFEIDGEDFAKLFGIGEKDEPSAPPASPKGRSGDDGGADDSQGIVRDLGGSYFGRGRKSS